MFTGRQAVFCELATSNFNRINVMVRKPNFYRSFAIGFALGAVAVFASVGNNGSLFSGSVVTPAIAATAE